MKWLFNNRKNASRWLFLYPLLLSVPYFFDYIYPSANAQFSDITVTHYPNLRYLQVSLAKWKTVPLWSPMILSGFPFAADPLSNLWYPPGWLALIFPSPLGFNLLAYLHLVWGSIGMYQLLRAEGLDNTPALIGGLAFGSMPKLFAHYGAGHITLIFAVSWTPWMLLAHSLRRSFFQSGLVLGLIFLADPRWAAFAGILWVSWVFTNWVRESRKNPLQKIYRGGETDRKPFRNFLEQCVLAVGVSAPLAVPFAEYTLNSTRWNLPLEEVFAFSLPPARLLGIFFPDFGGFHEWVFYPGGVVVVLGILAAAVKRTRERARFWTWLVLLSVLYALGENIPFLTLLGGFPPFSLLRVPSRALFLTGMGLGALSAYGMGYLLTEVITAERKGATRVLVGLGGFGVAMVLGILIFIGAIPKNFAWGGLVLLISVGLSIVILRARVRWLIPILIIISLIDWGVVNLTLFAPRDPSEVFSEQEDTARYLASQEGQFRVYSPSYSLPQHTAARFGLELADGVSPMQLASYVEFMTQATGVPREGYSVTIPTFEGEPAEVNRPYLPDPGLLGLLNVRYVAAEYDLDVEGLVLQQRFGETRVYENTNGLPRAWVQPIASKVGDRVSRVPIEWTPNRIVVNVEGSGLLVLSEVVYPGWQVWVDGERESLINVAGILRGVEIREGEHEVVFVYRPVSLYIGLGILMLIMVWFGLKVQSEQPR